MPRIHVCSLQRIEDVARASGAQSLLTLINPDFPVTRPATIDASKHLRLSLADIVAPDGDHIAPTESHVLDMLAFAQAWDRSAPLLIHCYAGVSRSTAAAMIIVAALRPERDEYDIAQTLRQRSPTATPNPLLICHADAHLQRSGKLIAAAASIGRGEDCFEGNPFALELD